MNAIQKLPDDIASQMKTTGMWKQDCPVSIERLRLVTVPYVNFEGLENNSGELIALDVASKHILAIFQELYSRRFPIAKIKSLHHYAGNDQLSMEENNTSCFNHRDIEGSSITSLHSYGLAVDLNPVQNPIIQDDPASGTKTVEPKIGSKHLDRRTHAGMNENIVPLFAEHGFSIWGGNWKSPIDYHHFQVPRGVAELLAALEPEDGEIFFSMCVSNQEMALALPTGKDLEPLILLYKSGRDSFFQQIAAKI